MRKPALVVAAVMALAACATGSADSPRYNADRISRVEVDQAGPSSAYDLVQKLRPIWLRKRGSTSFTQEGDIVIYLDGTRMGDRESLRTIHTANVETLEFLDARRATARLGAGHVNGAILITTRG